MGALIVSKRELLAALWPVDVRAGAEENFGGLHDRFRKRWVRMNCQCYVLGERRHFNRQYTFRNHLSRARAYDSHSQDPFILWIDEEFRHALGAIESNGAAGGGPGKLGDLNLAIFFLRLRLRQAAP